MKKHLSVFMLMARSTIYKVIALLLVAVAVTIALFYKKMDPAYATLDMVFSESWLPMAILIVSIVLMFVLLARTGCEFSSHQGYTLRRLSIPEREVFLVQAIYNALCFFMLWGVLMLANLALCYLYMSRTDPTAVSGQAMFLAIYKSSFLHTLLPLDDWSQHLVNSSVLLCLGFVSASVPFWQRRGSIARSFFSWFALIVAMLAFALFIYANTNNLVLDFLLIALALTISILVTRVIWRRSVSDEED